jgi:predicted ATPase
VPQPVAAPEQQDFDTLIQQPAVLLFMNRAQSVNNAFGLNLANAAAIVGLCAFSQGIPLVIELMAARMHMLASQELLAQITTSQTPMDFLLTLTGPRDSPQRQLTLAKAIGWSFDLLPAEEQRLLLKLAVFLGGFTLESAVAVCDATCSRLNR